MLMEHSLNKPWHSGSSFKKYLNVFKQRQTTQLLLGFKILFKRLHWTPLFTPAT